ncbi:hypothetical protein FRB95_013353 [Tulasnella sp. JGI-2019a]|nr:hypothetical protein FRB95_013353 [Tulasnella sp. JGI-2019a]
METKMMDPLTRALLTQTTAEGYLEAETWVDGWGRCPARSQGSRIWGCGAVRCSPFMYHTIRRVTLPSFPNTMLAAANFLAAAAGPTAQANAFILP